MTFRLSRQVQKGYTPATFFSYDGWNMVQEGATAANADRVYLHGDRVDEIVASQVNGTWYNHHYDAQGNCNLLSTGSGGIQEQYDYDAFGFSYFYTASGGTPDHIKTRFVFTGRECIRYGSFSLCVSGSKYTAKPWIAFLGIELLTCQAWSGLTNGRFVDDIRTALRRHCLCLDPCW